MLLLPVQLGLNLTGLWVNKMKGWHKESYRHYLASKGIKTNRYMKHKPVRNVVDVNLSKKYMADKLLEFDGNSDTLRKIPNFGAKPKDWAPSGWKLVKTHFVSKMPGGDGGPATSFEDFADGAKKGSSYAIVDEGQFQVYVGEFERKEKEKKYMATRKQIWDTMDELEGKEIGSSYDNLQKERVRQGYKKEVPVKDKSVKKGATDKLKSSTYEERKKSLDGGVDRIRNDEQGYFISREWKDGTSLAPKKRYKTIQEAEKQRDIGLWLRIGDRI